MPVQRSAEPARAVMIRSVLSVADAKTEGTRERRVAAVLAAMRAG